MNKLYVKVVAYNPVTNVVTALERIDIDDDEYNRLSDEAFYRVLALANRTTDIIIGKTIGGNFYQLSPTVYGSYIKEDASSIKKFIQINKLLVAIADYHKKHNIPFD